MTKFSTWGVAACFALLGVAGCKAGERTQTAPEPQVEAAVLKIATDALAACPRAEDTDADALIRRARKAGWPAFVENERPDWVRDPEPDHASTDVDKRAVWIVRAAEPSRTSGRVELVIGQNARGAAAGPGFKPVSRQLGCVLRILPRSSGRPGLLLPTDFDAVVAAMTRYAGAGPSIERAAPAIGGDAASMRMAIWSYRLDDGRWVPLGADEDFEAGRADAPVQRRRALSVREDPTGLFVNVSNFTL